MLQLLINIVRIFIPQQLRLHSFLRRYIYKISEMKVISGPFKGMKMDGAASEIKYLLGTYERELHRTIEDLFSYEFKTMVNVGAEKGYYAVGFAMRCPKTHVTAFEADSGRRKILQRQININHVSQSVTVKGYCDMTLFSRSILGSKCLIIMDCEGTELIFLTPSYVPALKKCHILVELHDSFDDRRAAVIRKRFAQTHIIKQIWEQPRTIEDFPIVLRPKLIKKIFTGSALYNMDEERFMKMQWFYMIPREQLGKNQ